jgi:ketosteroid isomerase-like protein
MNATDTKIVVVRFNDCINAQDLEGLSRLMTSDHVFVGSSGNSVVGKQACVNAWKSFFAAFPDYQNLFDRFRMTGDIVAVAGRSSCADKRLDGPALWMAKVRGGRVSEWHVFEDTDDNRAKLSL